MSDALILLWRAEDSEIPAEIDEADFPIEAIEIIAKVLADNKHKYPVGHWRNVSKEDHLQHAFDHIKNIIDYGWRDDFKEPHLLHALTRLAMAVAVKKEEQNGRSNNT